jgi:hypothetical protein
VKESSGGEIITISAETNGGIGYDNITLTIGAEITAIIHMWGAGGGGSKRTGSISGGSGGYARGTYTFSPGTYRVVVGGAGEGGSQDPKK